MQWEQTVVIQLGECRLLSFCFYFKPKGRTLIPSHFPLRRMKQRILFHCNWNLIPTWLPQLDQCDLHQSLGLKMGWWHGAEEHSPAVRVKHFQGINTVEVWCEWPRILSRVAGSLLCDSQFLAGILALSHVLYLNMFFLGGTLNRSAKKPGSDWKHQL